MGTMHSKVTRQSFYGRYSTCLSTQLPQSGKFDVCLGRRQWKRALAAVSATESMKQVTGAEQLELGARYEKTRRQCKAVKRH